MVVTRWQQAWPTPCTCPLRGATLSRDPTGRGPRSPMGAARALRRAARCGMMAHDVDGLLGNQGRLQFSHAPPRTGPLRLLRGYLILVSLSRCISAKVD